MENGSSCPDSALLVSDGAEQIGKIWECLQSCQDKLSSIWDFWEQPVAPSPVSLAADACKLRHPSQSRLASMRWTAIFSSSAASHHQGKYIEVFRVGSSRSVCSFPSPLLSLSCCSRILQKTFDGCFLPVSEHIFSLGPDYPSLDVSAAALYGFELLRPSRPSSHLRSCIHSRKAVSFFFLILLNDN